MTIFGVYELILMLIVTDSDHPHELEYFHGEILKLLDEKAISG